MMLGISSGGARNTTVNPWIASWDEITEALSSPEVGLKDGGYFTLPTFSDHHRHDESVQFPLHGFVLDGDSTIDLETGELREGAPPPEYVHEALVELDINHLIYSSHSHGAKGNRYRVLVPVEIRDAEEHRACVDWMIDQLHQKQVMIANVTENHTVSLPWYLPRISAEGAPFYFADFDESDVPLTVDEAVGWYRAFQQDIESVVVDEPHAPRELDPDSPIDYYCMSHGIAEVVEMLQEYGYLFMRTSMINNHPSYHLRAPESSSGSAGVNVWIGRDNGKVLVCSHHGEHDPLIKQENGKRVAVDAFEVFVQLEHKGDRKAAVEAAKAMMPQPDKSGGFGDLSYFSLRGMRKQMERQMLEDKYILGEVALLGQWTNFYAAPNSGKTLLTLHMLIEAIESSELVGSDVYYVNADDHYKGLVQKLSLAEEYGFEMLAPNQNGFKGEMLLPIMQKMAESGDARGKVVVIDTLKKFTDLMDKKTASDFGNLARQFVQAGGSVISMAHVNKHKDSDGRSVRAGTSDIQDDADCTYILEIINQSGDVKTVQFRNEKARGDVAQEATYRYTRAVGQTYFELLDSVESVDKDQAEKESMDYQRQQQADHNREAIDEVVACIRGGITLKTDLMKEVSARTGIGRNKVSKVLRQFNGNQPYQYWTARSGNHNSQIYALNEQTKLLGPVY